MKIVYLEWADALHNSSWFYAEQAIEWAKEAKWMVKEVGWIISETKEYIVFASRMKEEHDENDSYGGLQKIPKTWIKKRKELSL